MNSQIYLNNKTINSLNFFLADEDFMDHHYRTIINPFTDMIKSAINRETLPHSMLYVPQTNDYEFITGGNNQITGTTNNVAAMQPR